MRQSYDLMFASSNKNKYNEAKEILKTFNITLGFFKCELEEIQSDSVKEIASHKSQHAFLKCKCPVIIEDDGLFIDALNGFPGPYSSYVFKTIGNKGILQLVRSDRKAKFTSTISFTDKKNSSKIFEGTVLGKISQKSLGTGWGYDPIFVPEGEKKTFAQLENKNILSHRHKSLEKFAKWFGKRVSIDQ